MLPIEFVSSFIFTHQPNLIGQPMAKFSLMTLGGVITDPQAGLNYIMSCFFFSKYSQTDIYRGNVISLSKIVQQHGDNTVDVATEIERSLQTLLQRYFQVAVVEARAFDDGANIEVSIQGHVITEDSTGERRLDLGYSLSAADGTFKNIVDVLNNETIY